MVFAFLFYHLLLFLLVPFRKALYRYSVFSIKRVNNTKTENPSSLTPLIASSSFILPRESSKVLHALIRYPTYVVAIIMIISLHIASVVKSQKCSGHLHITHIYTFIYINFITALSNLHSRPKSRYPITTLYSVALIIPSHHFHFFKNCHPVPKSG